MIDALDLVIYMWLGAVAAMCIGSGVGMCFISWWAWNRRRDRQSHGKLPDRADRDDL